MRRRNFLKIAGAGTAAVAALPAGWYVATSVQEAAAGIITRELGYLTLEPKGVARFVDDYLKDPLSQYTPAKLKAYYALRTGADASMMVADLTRKYCFLPIISSTRWMSTKRCSTSGFTTRTGVPAPTRSPPCITPT